MTDQQLAAFIFIGGIYLVVGGVIASQSTDKPRMWFLLWLPVFLIGFCIRAIKELYLEIKSWIGD